MPGIAGLFMKDCRAQRRHCNPWSVCTCFSMMPLIALAFLSRAMPVWWSARCSPAR
ncbi:MAG: DUF6653 family protein [Armatimonadota bacterium]